MPRFGQRVVFVASLVLLLLLAVAQLYRLSFGEEEELRQATLQSVRSQRVAKIALILKDPSIEKNVRIQAVSELQNTLPAWEKQQARMQGYQTESLRVLMIQSQPDFAAMDTAAWVILANPNKPADPVQVGIILQREHNYTTNMTQLAMLVQQRLEEIDHEIVLFEQIVTALLFIAIVTPPIWSLIADRIKQQSAPTTDITSLSGTSAYTNALSSGNFSFSGSGAGNRAVTVTNNPSNLFSTTGSPAASAANYTDAYLVNTNPVASASHVAVHIYFYAPASVNSSSSLRVDITEKI